MDGGIKEALFWAVLAFLMIDSFLQFFRFI